MPKSSRDKKGLISSGEAGYGNTFTKLFSNSDTGTYSNAATEGQVPPEYSGDPSSVVGQKGFVQKTGEFTPEPYKDTRNWFQRLTTANEAERQNAAYRLGQAGREQGFEDAERTLRLAEKVKQDNAQVNAVNEAASAALQTVATRYGLPPSEVALIQQVYQANVKEALAIAAQKEQEAKTAKLGSEIKAEGMGKTRIPDISSLVSQANENMFRTGESEKFARNNPKALEAGMMGRELAPAAALARSNTMSVGPGEYLKRFSSGSPVIDSFFSPAEGRGASQNKVTTMQNFGGMQIPHESSVTTPGTIEQTPPPTPKAALGRISLLSKPPTDMSQFQFSTPQFRNGQLQSNAMMPEDPIAEQERKKKEAAEAIMNLQRLFSQPQYTPNSINR